MNLSVKDVAGLLNVSQKTIYRMVRDETIPCFRVGGQWRFDRREIASWIEDTREFRYRAPRRGAGAGDDAIVVAELLQRGGIHYDVEGDSREQAVAACLERIRASQPQLDVRRLFAAIMDREHLCSTAAGSGVAFPHPRPFREFTAAVSSVALCRLNRPIPFNAIDNEKVDTLFFIFPKSEQRFLRIQAKLSRLLKEEQVFSAIMRRMPAGELIKLFQRAERQIFESGASAA